MINTIDHLIVAVSDINIAEKNYSKIFGSEPVWRGEHAEYGTENSLFNFNNTYFELLAAKGLALRRVGVALVDGDALVRALRRRGVAVPQENVVKPVRHGRVRVHQVADALQDGLEVVLLRPTPHQHVQRRVHVALGGAAVDVQLVLRRVQLEHERALVPRGRVGRVTVRRARAEVIQQGAFAVAHLDNLRAARAA